MPERDKTEERQNNRQHSRGAGMDREDTIGRPYPRANDRFTYTDWMIPGPFTGYGPAEYQQSRDARIMEEVNERLMQHGQLNAMGISVVVSNGKVSLQGVVSSERERIIAERVAHSVPGVRRVYDRLRISGDLYSQPPTE